MGKEKAALRLLETVAEELEPTIRQNSMATMILYTPIGDMVANAVRNIIDLFLNTPLVSDPYAVTVDKDTVNNTIKYLVALTTLLENFGEDVAEIAGEALSDGLSNALYSGLLGALDMMLRLYVGAIPPQSPFMTQNVDEEWQAFLDALSGTHYHLLGLGFLDRYIRGLRDDLLSDRIAHGILDAYVYAHYPELVIVSMFAEMFHNAVLRLMESIAAVLEALWARAEDAVMEWRAAKFLYEKGVLTYDEYAEAEARANAELDAIEEELNAIEEDLANALSGFSPAVPQSIVDAYTKLVDEIAARVDVDKPSLESYMLVLTNLRSRGHPTGFGYRVRVAGQDKDIYEVR